MPTISRARFWPFCSLELGAHLPRGRRGATAGRGRVRRESKPPIRTSTALSERSCPSRARRRRRCRAPRRTARPCLPSGPDWVNAYSASCCSRSASSSIALTLLRNASCFPDRRSVAAPLSLRRMSRIGMIVRLRQLAHLVVELLHLVRRQKLAVIGCEPEQEQQQIDVDAAIVLQARYRHRTRPAGDRSAARSARTAWSRSCWASFIARLLLRPFP